MSSGERKAEAKVGKPAAKQTPSRKRTTSARPSLVPSMVTSAIPDVDYDNKEKVRGCFQKLDTNHDGVLDFKELNKLLRDLNPKRTAKELEMMFANMDRNHNDEIEVDEFLSYLWAGQKKEERMLKEGLQMLFDAMDVEVRNRMANDALDDAYGHLAMVAAQVDAKPLELRPAVLWRTWTGSFEAFHSWALKALLPTLRSAEEVEAFAVGIASHVVGMAPPYVPAVGHASDRACLSEILPGQLFLTNWKGAYDAEEVKNANVTHILSLGSVFEGETPLAEQGIQYLWLSIEDDQDETAVRAMRELLSQAVSFIDSALEDPQRAGCVLVHCEAGISRSATVVLAYLVAKLDLSLVKAFKMVHRIRPVMWPSFGCMQALISWEENARKRPASMRLSQYKLWCEFAPDQYALAFEVDRK